VGAAHITGTGILYLAIIPILVVCKRVMHLIVTMAGPVCAITCAKDKRAASKKKEE